MRKGGGCFCWGRQLGLSHRARKQHTNNTQNNTQNNTHTHLCFCFYLYSQRGVWCLLRFYKNDSVGPFCQFFADTAKIQHKKLLCTKITKPQKKKKKKKKKQQRRKVRGGRQPLVELNACFVLGFSPTLFSSPSQTDRHPHH